MRVFIHPVFFIVAAVAIYYSAAVFMVALLVAVVIHESAHAAAAERFGISAVRISILPFGGAVDIDCNFLTLREKNFVLLAGPAANMFMSLLFGVMVWLFPVLFGFLEYLVAANFMVGIMNLMPIYPLDGGKILSGFVRPKYVLWGSNILFLTVFIAAAAALNFLLMFFAVVMMIQINFEYKSTKYKDKFSRTRPKTGRFAECAVLADKTLLCVYKMTDKRRPTKFIVTDRGGAVFFEADLERWLSSHPLHTSVGACLK